MGNCTIDDLRAKLARIDQRIADHDAECERTSGHVVNPDNEIGGMRSRSARAKGKLLDRWDNQARVSVALHDERRLLANRIAWIEAKPERDRADALALAGWDSLQVGDPNPLTGAPITEVNRASIVSSGNRWTMEEVTGLSPSRVAELRVTEQEQAA